MYVQIYIQMYICLLLILGPFLISHLLGMLSSLQGERKLGYVSSHLWEEKKKLLRNTPGLQRPLPACVAQNL